MVTKKDIMTRFEQAVRIAAAGADQVPDGLSFGPPVQIWRAHRDGSESYETLPEWLAILTLCDIVNSEPNTARAKIVRPPPDYYCLADLMARQPAMEAA